MAHEQNQIEFNKSTGILNLLKHFGNKLYLEGLWNTQHFPYCFDSFPI